MFQMAVLPFLLSLLIAARAIPAIIRVAHLKNLTDDPDDDRKLHKKNTPTLGGIAIFGGTLIVFSALYDVHGFTDLKFITPALVLLFFAGVKDDLLVLAPGKKLLIQIACAVLITYFGHLRLTSLWGIMGVQEVDFVTGTVLTVFCIVGLINAFNLIDGINGLAGTLGFSASLFFGAWFALNGFGSLTLLSFSLAGALLGFLFFNYNRAKIFMGDTGSMAVGFIVSVLAIRFIEANRVHVDQLTYPIINAPAVAFAALAIPIFDMTRVFILRLSKKRSPFRADRNHIHHYFIDNGVSHAKTNCVLFTVNLSCVLITLPLNQLRSAYGIVVVFAYLTAFSYLALYLLKRRLPLVLFKRSSYESDSVC